MGEELLKFYSRKDIQKEIVSIASNREVQVWFKSSTGELVRGKRPDMVQFEGDILDLARKGATSFHLSEERWKNPLELKPGMTQKQLDDLRIGWDLVLDIDCSFLEYSKIAAKLLIDALKFHDVKNISCKFSGGSGFHIGIPFESFPDEVNNTKTKFLFPEGVRVIASYLGDMIKEHLATEILKLSTLDEISNSTNKNISELKENDTFNPYSILEIDAILISNRHMFRAPYSLNEKKGLISIPILPEKINNFKLSQAKPENIKTDISFLDSSKVKSTDATQLIVQAFDWSSRQPREEFKIKQTRDYQLPTIAIKEEFFPPCICSILTGLKQDGRKRSIFILINFLKQMGWSLEDIETILLKWNQRNYQPLQEGYIRSQINWHKKQNQTILPPNCDNQSYYKGLALCNNKDTLCNKIKNPVNYVNRKLRIIKQNQPKKRKK